MKGEVTYRRRVSAIHAATDERVRLEKELAAAKEAESQAMLDFAAFLATLSAPAFREIAEELLKPFGKLHNNIRAMPQMVLWRESVRRGGKEDGNRENFHNRAAGAFRFNFQNLRNCGSE